MVGSSRERIKNVKSKTAENKLQAPHVKAKGRKSRRPKIQEFCRPRRVQHS